MSVWGTNTALSCAVHSVDMLRQTAESRGCVFLVEIAGKYSGFLTTMAGIECRADHVLIPENLYDLRPDTLGSRLDTLKAVVTSRIGGTSAGSLIICVSEGFGARFGFDISAIKTGLGRTLMDRASVGYVDGRQRVRVQRLVYIQKGLPPDAFDCWLAASYAKHTVEIIPKTRASFMVCRKNGNVGHVRLSGVVRDVEWWKGRREQVLNLPAAARMRAKEMFGCVGAA